MITAVTTPMLTLALMAPVALAACASDAPACPAAAQVHTWKPKFGQPSALARQVLDSLAHDPSGPRPDWVLADPRSGMIVFVGTDPGFARAQKIAETFDVDRAPPRPPIAMTPGPGPVVRPTLPAAASPFADDAAAQAALAQGVRAIDDTHWAIDRKLIDELLADPMAVGRSARVVPAIQNGAVDGVKLYAIRPDSLFQRLGFQNGDTLRAVNGLSLSSPDQALDAYAKLRSASTLEVELTRRGQDLVQYYAIQ
jgi:S1-C subfamily serine protease